MKITSCQPFRLIGILFIGLALFSIAGGHLALLQGVAWAKMLHHYSSQESFSSALEKTFSGKYRCSLCKKITEEKQKEKKTEAISGKIKIDGLLETALFVSLLVPNIFSYPNIIDSHYCGPIISPPAPYPIIGLA